MTISFNDIPSTLRVPFVYVEIDNSNAVQGPVVQPYKHLLIGQRLSAGTVAKHIPTRITSKEQAQTYFGIGSMLSQMADKHFKNNKITETWAIALDDDSGGASATGTLAFTGPASANGTLFLYIGGQRLTVGVTSGDSATTVGAAVASAINAMTSLSVTGSNTTGTVTLTARHKGVAGNKIDVRTNYNAGEALPAGLGLTITGMASGTSNPDVSAALAALGDVQYNVITFPYTDANSLTDIETELADRWGPMRQIEGVAITADNVSHANLGTLGDSRNSPFLSIMSCTGVMNPPWEVAAAVAGNVSYYGNIDPARQFKTLPLVEIYPPAQSARYTVAERNILLYDGISTFTIDAGGVVRIERIITTYKTNGAGADDPSYLDIMTPMLLGYIRYDFRNYILRKYPRHKLANDGTQYGQGQAIITPKVGKAEAVAKFRQWESMGLVENAEQFKRDLICERNITDPNRLDWLMSPDLVNNFMVGGVKVAFLLQGSEFAA